MEKIAIFPGSFDPFTIGHESIIQRALPLFDKIYIAIGKNSTKKSLFPAEERKAWIKKLFVSVPVIEVQFFTGLTIDFCKQVNAGYIIRGLRTSSDFEYERAIAQNNRTLNQEIETIFILTTPEHTHINSTIVREIHLNGGDISQFVPDLIAAEIKKNKS
jgi:pantetheine-phosphate adenylyltransferase